MSKTVSAQSTPQPRGPHCLAALADVDENAPVPFQLAAVPEDDTRPTAAGLPVADYVNKVLDTIRRANVDQDDAIRELVDMVTESTDPQTAAQIVVQAFDGIAAKVERRDVERQAVPPVRIELEASIIPDPDGAAALYLVATTEDLACEVIDPQLLRVEVAAARAKLDQLAEMADQFDQIQMESEPRPCWSWCQEHHTNPGEENCTAPSVHMGEQVFLPVPKYMAVPDYQLLSAYICADYSGDPEPKPMISVNSQGEGTVMPASEAVAFADELSLFAAELRRMARRLSEGTIPESGRGAAA